MSGGVGEHKRSRGDAGAVARSIAVTSVVVIVGALIFVGGTIAFIVWLIRRERHNNRTSGQLIEAFTAAMDRLGRREPDVSYPITWVVQRGDRRYRAGYRPGSRSPPTFWIRGDVTVTAAGGSTPFRGQGQRPLERPPRLIMRSETRRDRLGKALRLNRELQTGDEPFDRAVYLESDDPDELVGAIVGSAHLRHAVIALLALGPDHVQLGHPEQPVDVTWSGSQVDNPFAADRLDRAIAALDTFTGELPAFATAQADRRWPRGVGALIATLVGGFVGAVLMVWGGNVYQPVSNDPVYDWMLRGLVLTAIVTALGWWRARGGSRALRMVGWTAGLGVAAWPAVLAGAVMVCNGLFDGPSRRRTVHVVDRFITSSKNSTRHYLQLRPWPPHTRVKLRVDYDVYRRTELGPTDLRFGGGALGIEWYDGP